MPAALVESLEGRLILSGSPSPEIALIFPKSVSVRVGQRVPPIVVLAEDSNAKVARSFNEPVTFQYGPSGVSVGQFRHGVAVLRGLRFTSTAFNGITATASGATAGLGEIDVAPGPVVSFAVTQVFYGGPSLEWVELTAFDRYGNGTDDVSCNVRPKSTTTPGLTAVVQPPNPLVKGFSKVIYRNGHPVAVECGARTVFYISFGSATAAQVHATSVQLVFSSQRIKPVWTPPVTV